VDKTGEAIAEWQQLSVGGGDEEEAELGCEEEWRFVLARREGELSNNKGRCRSDGEGKGREGEGAGASTLTCE
jgi:hypothetical protein